MFIKDYLYKYMIFYNNEKYIYMIYIFAKWLLYSLKKINKLCSLKLVKSYNLV